MLDMGFEPTVRKLVSALGMPPNTERQTLMFSATFPDEIQNLARDFLNNYLFLTIGRVGSANTDITQSIFNVDRNSKKDELFQILNNRGQYKDIYLQLSTTVMLVQVQCCLN